MPPPPAARRASEACAAASAVALREPAGGAAPAICPVHNTVVTGFAASPQKWNGTAWVPSTDGYNWLAIGY